MSADANPICRGCGYSLAQLRAPRCPECGRAFDPADPASYAIDDPAARRRGVAAYTGLGAVIALLALAVPWTLVREFRLINAGWRAMALAAAVAAFAYAWSGLYRSRYLAWAAAACVPACAMIAAESLRSREWADAAAAAAGLTGGILLRRLLAEAATA